MTTITGSPIRLRLARGLYSASYEVRYPEAPQRSFACGSIQRLMVVPADPRCLAKADRFLTTGKAAVKNLPNVVAPGVWEIANANYLSGPTRQLKEVFDQYTDSPNKAHAMQALDYLSKGALFGEEAGELFFTSRAMRWNLGLSRAFCDLVAQNPIAQTTIITAAVAREEENTPEGYIPSYELPALYRELSDFVAQEGSITKPCVSLSGMPSPISMIKTRSRFLPVSLVLQEEAEEAIRTGQMDYPIRSRSKKREFDPTATKKQLKTILEKKHGITCDNDLFLSTLVTLSKYGFCFTVEMIKMCLGNQPALNAINGYAPSLIEYIEGPINVGALSVFCFQEEFIYYADGTSVYQDSKGDEIIIIRTPGGYLLALRSESTGQLDIDLGSSPYQACDLNMRYFQREYAKNKETGRIIPGLTEDSSDAEVVEMFNRFIGIRGADSQTIIRNRETLEDIFPLTLNNIFNALVNPSEEQRKQGIDAHHQRTLKKT